MMAWSITKAFLIIGVLSTLAMNCGQGNSSLTRIMSLPSAVKETSGLAVVGGKLYTLNDSGDGPYDR